MFHHMTLATLLLVLAFLCFLYEGLRANFNRSPPPPPPRYIISWGWVGLALCVASMLIGRV